MQATIKIKAGVPRMPKWRMAAPVDFEALSDEHIAIVGANGCGKTMLVEMLVGRHPLLGQDPVYDFSPSKRELAAENIKYITFRDCYGGDNDSTYYLQQRWNQHDIDEETPTVGELLEQEFLLTGKDMPERRAFQEHLYQLFGMDALLDKYIILLSSGELRKFQLTKALFSHPRILMMDNPFIGLDVVARRQLDDLLTTLSKEQALQLVLVLAKTDDIPGFITHVVVVDQMLVGTKMPVAEYLRVKKPRPASVLTNEKRDALLRLPYKADEYHAREVVRLRKVSIRYGERTILRELDWVVMNGERWALSGSNGSGKSTLLSLICADNPQGYASDITLFDIPRGSGETIWDIKRHIGYVSPEMHRSYRQNIPAIQIVASGLKDTVGLYVRPNDQEKEQCRKWLRRLGVEHLADRRFMEMSSGEQRLVLLARAFVKEPDLLILDEPLHGLDLENRRMVKDLVDDYCQNPEVTLIYVTHYQEELPSCIDHSIYLERQT